MRTTLDLPAPVLRDLKIKAAAEGVTMKQLLTRFVEKELYGSSRPNEVSRSPLPSFRKPSGTLHPALSNAEIENIMTEEDADLTD